MARRNDFISPEGLRVDGRRAGEVRRLVLRLGAAAASAASDGSAYAELGNTKLLVTVSGPHEAAHRGKAVHDSALLTVEVTALPCAGGQHRPQSTTDRTSVELGAAIRKTFESVIQLQLYPRTQIDVSVCVLQADGGVRSAAMNAVTLALIDAGVALEDFVCACSIGSIGGALLLDPNAQVGTGVP
jgi:exosome complex component RRP41